MSRGMIIYRPACSPFRGHAFGVLHIGVGFCIARSTEMGNARASERGTGDSMNPTLFSYMQIINTIKVSAWGWQCI